MASRKKVRPSQLDAAISSIMAEFRNEVDVDINKAIETVAKAGVKDLKAASRSTFGGTGKYAKGWKVTSEEDRVLKRKSVIHSKVPGLPHLLEHGHAKRGGGRTPGREHIAPIEQKIIEQFERELINEIQ